MSFELSIFTDMITTVESTKAVYGFEFHQITTAITKFRDWFTEKKDDYGIPQSLLDELNGYIAQFPTIMFGDHVLDTWTNNMIEALRVVGDLVQYISILLYRRVWYISPLLHRYYTSFLAGHWPEFWNTPFFATFDSVQWRLNSLGGYPAGASMGSFEHWFKMDRHYGSAKVYLKATMTAGQVDQPNITVYFLTSGEPKPGWPISGRESIVTRGDVTKVAETDFNYVSGQTSYEITNPIDVNADVTYVVVAERDDSGTHAYYTDIRELRVW